METRVCLAATCHDPKGSFADGMVGRDVLWPMFGAIAVNATEETHTRTIDALVARRPEAVVARHRAGSIGIGAARREALRLAVDTGCTHVLYSDLDHVLRWAALYPDELRRTAIPRESCDFTVIGRAPSAFELEPARLRATEAVVNQTASLAIGAAGHPWDFMMAVRFMNTRAAKELVTGCPEDSIGNDVAWPLHLHRVGMRLDYQAVQGLAYRHRDDFTAASDERDSDPREWVTRIEVAAKHAAAMRPYLDRRHE